MQAQTTQPLRPAWCGLFSLPTIAADVPTVIAGDGPRSRILARFAAAAERCGVPLPEGTFSSPEEVVTAQWAAYLAGQDHGVMERLTGNLLVQISDAHLQILLTAQPNLEVYRAKPVVTQLEALLPGLGWFVYETATAGSSHGLGLYDMSAAVYMGSYRLADLRSFDDECYAKLLLDEEGEEYELPLSEEKLAQMRDEYAGFWPSDVLAEIEGNTAMIRGYAKCNQLVANRQQAQKWLRQNSDHAMAPVVQAALALTSAWEGDKSRDFCLANAGQFDDHQFIGAPAFMVWDHPHMVSEMIEHGEQDLYNGGSSVAEVFGMCTLDLSRGVSDADLQRAARATVSYFERWKLLASLLSHFPTWSDDDAS